MKTIRPLGVPYLTNHSVMVQTLYNPGPSPGPIFTVFIKTHFDGTWMIYYEHYMLGHEITYISWTHYEHTLMRH